ncbi:EmrB/QacA subfamily drug resistance transporter [Kitasatospora sp. MAA4]|uniref:MFS transporter n=1 Tax=Kitasatospora sp. MAA4 TaxID=3035093 RepID=UPI002474CDE2|nr:MFS transporter [Kitasatospora sp. MAA4]MDH6133228.1 EmrB/QacA subfamily drug resistance transporter [Kitasatospora sp. MAA4]
MSATVPIPAADPVSAAGDRRRWIALAVVMTASFMDLVDVTIVNIAVPSIQHHLGASFSAIQWVTGGYALAFAIGLITGGRLGDIYGRKRIFLIGIAGFTLASALCGFAGDPAVLVATRILQGATAALMVPQVLAIIHVTFPAHERGKVFGLFGAMIGLGAVSGPLLGALLTEWNLFGLEWRPIFLINLPVGIAGLLLGHRYVVESRAPQSLRLDLVGMALAGLGLLMLLYPLTQGRESGWPLWGFVSMACSPLVLALFVRYERIKTRRDGSPLVELSLFQVRSFAAGVGVQLTFGVVCGIFFLVWTLYMQLGLGWSPLRAGTTGIPFSIAVSAAAGLSVAKLVPRFGRKVLQAGALVMAVGALIYLAEANRYGAGIHPWQMALPLVVMGAGMGLVVAPLTDSVLSDVPREHSGSASGLINTTQQLGNALGLGLVSVAFFTVVDHADFAHSSVSAVFTDAFTHALWWVVGGLLAMSALLLALPPKARPHTDEEADQAPADQAQTQALPVG